jgi:glutamate N-acetyltransferase/amino-acid N-acetyltransferase
MAIKMDIESLNLQQHSGRGVSFPRGFRVSSVRAGLKSRNKDLILILSETPASAAGVFTTNLVHAASVDYSKRVVAEGVAQAIFANAGNANACTGPQGEADNLRCAELTANALGLHSSSVLVASTGVIGRPMPMEKIETALPSAADGLSASAEADVEAARAILTTDTRPKKIALEVRSLHWEGAIRIAGIAKGSGMIAPNMATTLCFVTTDAKIRPNLLQGALWKSTEKSFNRVTVDGDTSTNDMVLVLANGASGQDVNQGAALSDFCAALDHVLLYLAKEVARDGEGATKLIQVTVRGAANEASAAKVAKTIAESPLVKTALFGCDPNWGRIMAAAGRAGVPFNPIQADAFLGGHQVFVQGKGAAFDPDEVHAYLKNSEIELTVSLGTGPGEATYWTCDYSYDYVKINAEYHT